LVRKRADEDDPAPPSVKTLVVDYTIEGKPFTVKGTDPTTLHSHGASFWAHRLPIEIRIDVELGRNAFFENCYLQGKPAVAQHAATVRPALKLFAGVRFLDGYWRIVPGS
jgi:hypothetical protein